MKTWAAHQTSHRPDEPDGSGLISSSFSALLAATADRHATRVAFRDPVGREDWSGRPAIEWTYAVARQIVSRLSARFRAFDLAPGSIVGVALAGSSESCLAILAIEDAGLVPCLLPIAWSESDLAAAINVADVQALVTQGVLGDERPAEMFCRIAARCFGLRFLCCFGPSVPDGVIDLDRVLIDVNPGARDDVDRHESGSGWVTFDKCEPVRPVFRPREGWIAAAMTFLVVAEIGPGERILTLVAPDDLPGLVTSVVASLLSGATLEQHGLFSGEALVAACRLQTPTHLVAPEWMEPALAAANLPSTIRSVILIHRGPSRFKVRTALKTNVIDVLALDEWAIVAGRRDVKGQLAAALEEQSSSVEGGLLRVRQDEVGSLKFAGPAAEAIELPRGSVATAVASTVEWRSSRFKVDRFAGIAIGVSESAP